MLFRKIQVSIIIFVILLFAFSCGPVIKVNANAYKLGNTDYINSKSICVFTPNKDRALSEDLKKKIIKILIHKGFIVKNDCKDADYILVFDFTIKSEKYSYSFYFPIQNTQNIYGYYYGSSTGSFYAEVQDTKYIPIRGYKTIYHRALLFMLFNKYEVQQNPKDIKPIWQLEIISSGSGNDLRFLSDFLLIPFYKYFLKDTHKRIELKLTEWNKDYKELRKILYE